MHEAAARKIDRGRSTGNSVGLQACSDNFVDLVISANINVVALSGLTRLSHSRPPAGLPCLAAPDPGEYDPHTISSRQGPAGRLRRITPYEGLRRCKHPQRGGG